MQVNQHRKIPFKYFSPAELEVLENALWVAEDLVSNHYKMTKSQWLKNRYDVKTLKDLFPYEITEGPFAQVIRYEGKPIDSELLSSSYDFYKICIQDHAILNKLDEEKCIDLYPFSLYIITHELIHIVRFAKFLQNYSASEYEKEAEEKRVHEKTIEILSGISAPGLETIFSFYV